jgi:hypothetical protein
MNFMEICCEVGETGSGSYLIVCFAIGIFKSSHCTARCVDWWIRLPDG